MLYHMEQMKLLRHWSDIFPHVSRNIISFCVQPISRCRVCALNDKRRLSPMWFPSVVSRSVPVAQRSAALSGNCCNLLASLPPSSTGTYGVPIATLDTASRRQTMSAIGALCASDAERIRSQRVGPGASDETPLNYRLRY